MFDSVAGFLEKTSVAVLLGVAVIGALNRWWVPGYLYDRAIADRDKAVRDRDDQTKIALHSVRTLEVMTEYFRGRRPRQARGK